MTDSSNNTLLGHPRGLFLLYFVEMWERFSYYGMRALLIFYMIKGFMKYNDKSAYAVYGAYCALVYATPFIGGMIADKVLGARRAVIMGAVLMSLGHLLMTFENQSIFFCALAVLICGNGFFKPNISTIVGSLYEKTKLNRDAGFTIFYIGINLGAALSPLVCGYVGETFGWHYGFGLATIGMMLGLAIFVAPMRITQVLIVLCSLATAISLIFFQSHPIKLVVNIFVALVLISSAVIAFIALGKGGLPKEAGRLKDLKAASRKIFGFLRADIAVYIGVIISIPIIMALVNRGKITGIVLIVFGGLSFLYLLYFAFKSQKIERERLFVVLILTFFSMLFWSFFEQAGSSVNNFTDRNIDRVSEEYRIKPEHVGKTIKIEANQEQLGYTNGANKAFTITDLEKIRDEARKGKLEGNPEAGMIEWEVSEDDVGMGVNGSEIPASQFQSANPIFIMIFGLLFTAFWSFLAARKMEPNTTIKFAMGLLQLGLGFGALWYGAMYTADARGMVAVSWLLLGYLLHTTGELCLSPVGLAMVTRLSPAKVVSTVMGAWFLATAFSNYLAAMIAQLTGVSHGGNGEHTIPPPIETVGIYGSVFGKIAISAIISAVICFILSPLLKRWMHEEEN